MNKIIKKFNKIKYYNKIIYFYNFFFKISSFSLILHPLNFIYWLLNLFSDCFNFNLNILYFRKFYNLNNLIFINNNLNKYLIFIITKKFFNFFYFYKKNFYINLYKFNMNFQIIKLGSNLVTFNFLNNLINNDQINIYLNFIEKNLKILNLIWLKTFFNYFYLKTLNLICMSIVIKLFIFKKFIF